MSTSGNTPGSGQSTVFSGPRKMPASEETRLAVREQLLIALKTLLIITRITIIFIAALLADTLIVKIIVWSFGDSISHNLFASKLLDGIQLLSALGTAIAYIFYLIRSLFKDADEMIKEIKTKQKVK